MVLAHKVIKVLYQGIILYVLVYYDCIRVLYQGIILCVSMLASDTIYVLGYYSRLLYLKGITVLVYKVFYYVII